ERKQHRERLSAQQVHDRHRFGLFGLDKLGGLDDLRAHIKPSGSNQHPEEIRNPPSPADQLVMGQQRRQGDAKQRSHSRDESASGKLPAGAEPAAAAAMLGQEADGTAEFATYRKSRQ